MSQFDTLFGFIFALRWKMDPVSHPFFCEFHIYIVFFRYFRWYFDYFRIGFDCLTKLEKQNGGWFAALFYLQYDMHC